MDGTNVMPIPILILLPINGATNSEPAVGGSTAATATDGRDGCVQRKTQHKAERTVNGEYARAEATTCVMELHVMTLPQQREQGMIYCIVVVIWINHDVG